MFPNDWNTPDLENDFGKIVKGMLLTLALPWGGLGAERILMGCAKDLREFRYYHPECRKCTQTHEWRRVILPGYTHYLVSNWGFVRLASSPDRREDYLPPTPSHSYARVGLCVLGSATGGKPYLVHKLVVQSFPLPNETFIEGRKINHIDGDKWNPARNNLIVGTQGENMIHAYRTGLRRPARKR